MDTLVRRALEVLSRAGVVLGPGLTDAALVEREHELGFRYAPDHRTLLRAALPTGPGWVDWRDASTTELRDRLDGWRPGIEFDVQHNGFWPASWGPRPDGDRHLAVARERLSALPVMVPLYRHRYVPGGHDGDGPSPVFSIHQTDVIYYGRDLADYAMREFTPAAAGPVDLDGITPVPFWSPLALGAENADL